MNVGRAEIEVHLTTRLPLVTSSNGELTVIRTAPISATQRNLLLPKSR
jgi:hypothetical protein